MSDLLNSASLVMIPSGYKEDTVYSVVPSDGAGDMSFTRASNGTRINSQGLVEVCPWNLVQYSEDFSNAAWTKLNGIAVTTNTINAPNGTLTADTIEKAGGSGGVGFYYIVQNTIFEQLTNFFYVKYKSGSGIIWLLGKNSGTFAFYDVINGTALSKSSGMTTSIESIGDGWYKCIFSQTYVGATSTEFGIGLCLTDGTPNYNATTAATQSVYIWGAQSSISSTAKPYFPTTDRLNVPRLTYQNGGGGCPSLLLEKQSTNLLTWSEQFDNAAWSKSNVTITANNTTSPDGTQNADLSTATAGGELLQGVVLSTSTSYTFSFYVKKGTASDAKYRVYNFDAGVNVVAPTSYISQTSTSDWVRVVVSFTTGATGTNYGIYLLDQTSAGTMYFYGAQVEASSYPTSYIPTTSSSATRVADACFKTGISSLIGGGVGTWFMDFEFIEDTISNYTFAFNLSDGTITNHLYLYYNNPSWYWGGVDTAITLPSTLRKKVAIKYSSGTGKLFCNGSLISTLSISSSFSRLDIGNRFSQNYPMDGKINEAYFLTTSLTDAECQSLTTL